MNAAHILGIDVLGVQAPRRRSVTPKVSGKIRTMAEVAQHAKAAAARASKVHAKAKAAADKGKRAVIVHNREKAKAKARSDQKAVAKHEAAVRQIEDKTKRLSGAVKKHITTAAVAGKHVVPAQKQVLSVQKLTRGAVHGDVLGDGTAGAGSKVMWDTKVNEVNGDWAYNGGDEASTGWTVGILAPPSYTSTAAGVAAAKAVGLEIISQTEAASRAAAAIDAANGQGDEAEASADDLSTSTDEGLGLPPTDPMTTTANALDPGSLSLDPSLTSAPSATPPPPTLDPYTPTSFDPSAAPTPMPAAVPLTPSPADDEVSPADAPRKPRAKTHAAAANVSEESFLTKKVLGPLPGWSLIAAGAPVLGGAAYYAWKVLR